jgi:CRP-like cAMP-binding protein
MPYHGGSALAVGPANPMEQDLVDRLLAEESLIRENYLRYLTSRIRFLSSRLQSVAQSGAEGKVARYLLANHDENNTFTCSATDLAQRLGISRATLYRAFSTLEEGELIRRKGKHIIIPSLSTLEGAL